MFDLRKLFGRDESHRGGSHGHETEVDVPLRDEGLEAEYEHLIARQCRRWGITEESVALEVRQIGRAVDGRDVYVGMVRLAQWERSSIVRLLLGLPVLETRVRRTARSTWFGEISHFGGIWLHASEQLHATGAMRELRELMNEVAPQPAAESQLSVLPAAAIKHEASGGEPSTEPLYPEDTTLPGPAPAG